MHYWWSYFRAVLPGVLWMLTCMLPPLAGLVCARREMNLGNRSNAVVFLFASLAAGLTSLLLVGPFLWGRGLDSSTGPLVWVVAPILSTTVLAAAIAVGRAVSRRARRSTQAVRSSPLANTALLGPAAAVIVCVLLVSITRYAFRNGGIVVAERASDPDVLRQLYRREGATSASSGVQLFLAQNRATPGDVLDALSRSDFAHVRVHVAANGNTPSSTRARLTADMNSNLRSSAQRQRPPMP